MDEYKTILRAADAEFVEKKSRFIGHVRPVSTEEEALAFLAEMRARYWDASHNVYAYRIREGGAQRYSDDGEPQGTSGLPSLDVLRKSGVTDVIAVVTRYFGGTLLGAGGLVRGVLPHGISRFAAGGHRRDASLHACTADLFLQPVRPCGCPDSGTRRRFGRR